MGKSRILNLSKKGMLGAAAVTALPVAAVLGTAGLTTPAAAVGQEDKVTLSIATSCTFANTGGAVAQDGTFTASGLNGQEATFDNGGLHLFNVACNNLSGYTIRAYATDLQNNNITEATIPFKDLDEYNASINGDYARWTASISGGNEGAVFGRSSSDTKVIKSQSTPSIASGDEFSVTYKAYIGKTTTAGTYEGDAVYTLIMNPLTPTTYTWNIIYHADGSPAVPQNQTGEVNLGETTTATISNLVPVKDGYHLAGWDTNSAATEVVYAPGQTIDISQTNNLINLYAVWEENKTGDDLWTIVYDANGGTNAPSMSAVLATPSSNANITIASNIPTRSASAPQAYYFLGWSTNPDATTPDSGFERGRTPTITLNESTPTMTLYAVWDLRTYFQTVGTTQAEAKAWCNTLTTWNSGNSAATTYTLYDQRDEKSYLVRKLADANCWMVQNLALEGDIMITPADSDVTSNYTLPSSSTSGWSDDSTAYMWNGNHEDAKQDTAITAHGIATSNTGAYYSFLVATAGTGTGSRGDAAQSICPKGWKLPTGGATGKQYNTLVKYYSADSSFKTAFNVAFTGVCDSTYCPDANGYAHYWSSSIYNSSSGYSLYATNPTVLPEYGISKRNGYSVRCVLLAS